MSQTLFDAVFWDLDATLLDHIKPERNSISFCFREFGFGECSSEMLDEYPAINTKWWSRIEKGEIPKEEALIGRFTEFLRFCNVDCSVAREFNKLYMRHLGDTVCFLPGARETLISLKKIVRQYIVTNGVHASQDGKIKQSGIGDIVDGVFVSEDYPHEKPHREFFDCILDGLHLNDRSRVLMVGDSLSADMQGSYNAGIKSVWYNPCRKKNVTGVKIDWEISNLPDVIRIIKTGTVL